MALALATTTTTANPVLPSITSSELFNLLQDSARTKVVVDLRDDAKFASSCLRAAIQVKWPQQQPTTVAELKDAKCSRYAWDEKECTIKDSRDWANRGMLFKFVVLYDDGDESDTTENTSNSNSNSAIINVQKLLIQEGKVNKDNVFVLKGGFRNFSAEYEFLCSSKEKKKSALDGQLPSEIWARFLFLGSYENAKTDKQLSSLGITHILNMADELENPHAAEKYVYRKMGVNDTREDDIKQHIMQAISFINESRASSPSSRILVHCAMGISRSSAIVIAWLMVENKWTYEQSKLYVKSLRSSIKPNEGFVKQLLVFEKELLPAAN